VTTAAVLAHIAEVDARRLYAPVGYPSMHAYCVGELRLSEDAAFRRIRAARAGREFPTLFAALADGRLHLAAMSLLAPHLTRENVDELIEAATHRRKSEIEEMLARPFSCSEGNASLHAVPALSSELAQLVPGRVGSGVPMLPQLVPGHVRNHPGTSGDTFDPTHSPGHIGDPHAEAAATAESFLLKLTIGRSTREKLRYAQDLLSHAVPSGDLAVVLERLIEAGIEQIEKRRFGATESPRKGPGRPSTNPRRIPNRVKRAVWKRDGGQCSFVSDAGHRCDERRFLEFDHIHPVARGGLATVENLRLRCRAHNQFEAERAFGRAYMEERRAQSRTAAGGGRSGAGRARRVDAGHRVAFAGARGRRDRSRRRGRPHSEKRVERMQSSVAVIGGGIGGLATAYFLTQQGLRPVVLEASDRLGGLATHFEHEGVTLDRWYHVMLDSDADLCGLLAELALSDRITWAETGMGFYLGGQLYAFNTPLDVLRFRALSLIDRLRTGLGALYITRAVRDGLPLDDVPVADWLRRISVRVFVRSGARCCAPSSASVSPPCRRTGCGTR
jgi:hypothetical protein